MASVDPAIPQTLNNNAEESISPVTEGAEGQDISSSNNSLERHRHVLSAKIEDVHLIFDDETHTIVLLMQHPHVDIATALTCLLPLSGFSSAQTSAKSLKIIVASMPCCLDASRYAPIPPSAIYEITELTTGVSLCEIYELNYQQVLIWANYALPRVIVQTSRQMDSEKNQQLGHGNDRKISKDDLDDPIFIDENGARVSLDQSSRQVLNLKVF